MPHDSASDVARTLAAGASLLDDPNVTVNPLPVTFEVPRENPETGEMETVSITALQRLDRAQGGMTLSEAQELAARERSLFGPGGQPPALHGITSGGVHRDMDLTIPSREVAPVFTPTSQDDISKAIAAGRICSSCRHFDRELGQRRFLKEKLYQAIVRELAWKPEWFDPRQYGACHANPRDAVHEGASCEAYEPKGKLVSLLGNFRRK